MEQVLRVAQRAECFSELHEAMQLDSLMRVVFLPLEGRLPAREVFPAWR